MHGEAEGGVHLQHKGDDRNLTRTEAGVGGEKEGALCRWVGVPRSQACTQQRYRRAPSALRTLGDDERRFFLFGGARNVLRLVRG